MEEDDNKAVGDRIHTGLRDKMEERITLMTIQQCPTNLAAPICPEATGEETEEYKEDVLLPLFCVRRKPTSPHPTATTEAPAPYQGKGNIGRFPIQPSGKLKKPKVVA